VAKYLGIDYGSKRIGIALSDDNGLIAFPRSTLMNDQTLIPILTELIQKQSVDVVVVGESKDKDGNDNPIMKKARRFALELEQHVAVQIYFEPEYYSSVEAKKGATNSFVDAGAASIILNRYIERAKNNDFITG